ncbi:Uncharacterized protein SCUP515_03894 [Seiridium cupressi]
MQIRAVHAETHLPVLRNLIRDYPLGVLTTAIPSTTYPLIQSSLPWILDVQNEPRSDSELGVLRGHVARGNPQSKAMIESLAAPDRKESRSDVLEQEVLVLFTSPVHSYVTPKFYTETKPATGKVVPTWDYAAVQVYGRATIFHESESEESSNFLSKQIDDLSLHMEKHISGHTGEGDRPRPWLVSDAPEKYIELLKKNIIGIEIKIDRLEGVTKMSQEKAGGRSFGGYSGVREFGFPPWSWYGRNGDATT